MSHHNNIYDIFPEKLFVKKLNMEYLDSICKKNLKLFTSFDKFKSIENKSCVVKTLEFCKKIMRLFIKFNKFVWNRESSIRNKDNYNYNNYNNKNISNINSNIEHDQFSESNSFFKMYQKFYNFVNHCMKYKKLMKPSINIIGTNSRYALTNIERMFKNNDFVIFGKF